MRLWIVQELRRGGVPVVATAHTDAVAAHHLAADRPFLRGSDAKALASEAEAGAVLLTKIGVKDGKLELWIRAYDGNGELIAVGRGAGRVATLGGALVEALRPVQAAFAAGSTETQLPPRLAELGSYERALERLTSGELAAAWRELAGIRSPTAEALREDIVTLSAAPEVVAAERSRLSSLRGANDPDWLAIRHSLQRERNEALLLAGAEHASAADDPEGALVLFAEAAKVAPRSLAAERGRARVLAALDRHADAKAAFERVIALAPEDIEARLASARNPTLAPAEQARRLFEAGELQSRALDEEGARASFATAASVDADLGAAPRAARRSTGGDARQRRRGTRRLGRSGGHERRRDRRGPRGARPDALAQRRRRRRRASRSRRCRADSPKDPEALLGYGESLLAQGKAEQALAQLEQALALAPREADTAARWPEPSRPAGQADAALRVLDPEQVDSKSVRRSSRRAPRSTPRRAGWSRRRPRSSRPSRSSPTSRRCARRWRRLHADAPATWSGRGSEAGRWSSRSPARRAEIETSGPRDAPRARRQRAATSSRRWPRASRTATPERRPIGRVAWLGPRCRQRAGARSCAPG